MLRACNSHILAIIIPIMVEHLKFIPDLLNLFLISMGVKDIHGPLKIGARLCKLHRYVHGAKQFQGPCSLERILSKDLFLQLYNLKQLIDSLLKPLSLE